MSVPTPASQTLIVLSSEPDTIVLPSGEKATENTQSLCALLLRLELQGSCHKDRGYQYWAKGWRVSVRPHLHPRL